WKAYQKEKADPAKESVLPDGLTEGMTLPVTAVTIKEGKTTAPKHYTEDTLLSAMETAGAKDMPEDAERKGIGTPATRAGILEKLVSTGFVERKKQKKATNLIPTQIGVSLITVLPEQRSEERRVGKECRSRWWTYKYQEKKQYIKDNKRTRPRKKGET